MKWSELVARGSARYADGEARLDGEQLVRLGNAAYGVGLALLMEGRDDEARAWLARAAMRWRESWEHATPTSWGRPIGVVKARLLAGDELGAHEAAAWALTLGCIDAESPIGRYAATLALLVQERWEDARHLAASIRERDDFPHDVADALAMIAAHDVIGYVEAVESVVASFENRDSYLEDVPVADTALVLQALAQTRGIDVELPRSVVLPAAAET
jgi:hypothetical protein